MTAWLAVVEHNIGWIFLAFALGGCVGWAACGGRTGQQGGSGDERAGA